MAVDLVTTYPGRVDAADAEYPFGKPRNRTAPGDGTPFDEALYRDFVGWASAAMKQAGITAVSNVPDKVGTSEILQGIARHIAGGSVYMIDSGIADAYVLTPVQITAPDRFESPNILFDGMRAEFIAINSNTGAATINVNGTGVKSIVREDGTALSAGDIDTIITTIVRYNLSADKFFLVSGAATKKGILKNIQYFSISGTYTPTSGTKNIEVMLSGGGGGGGGGDSDANASDGGTSTFTGGTFAMTATGGVGAKRATSSALNNPGAANGSSSGGTLNLSGNGSSGGNGGFRETTNISGLSGGDGGLCFKFAAVPVSATVVIGAGGAASTGGPGTVPESAGSDGEDGYCIVKEYG